MPRRAAFAPARPLSPADTALRGGVLGRRLRIHLRTTLDYCFRRCEETGRIAALKQDWKPGQPNKPHKFYDSDVAKVVEGAAYTLALRKDPALYKRTRRIIALILRAQRPDGYLNSYFTTVTPRARFTNLRDDHELYCAGHLTEAAVAWFEATGERDFLDAMARYISLIARTFGRGRGQKRGYPGHEELELALVKLYRATGERRHLALARYFVDERGRAPSYFDREATARGAATTDLTQYQAHLPVRKQKQAVGHAVRAMYLYTAMADVAAECGDASLRRACRTLWRNVAERRMYIIGSVGSSAQGERFTADYDLPNETAYAETCAAIGLALWAQRMANLERDAYYADVMERAIYNGVLSGVALRGDRFFYANPLAVFPTTFDSVRANVQPVRQPWFNCACCPTNLARVLPALGSFAYAQCDGEARVHLYASGEARFRFGETAVWVKQTTDYPWTDRVRLDVAPERPAAFTLALRLPGWCRAPKLHVNGRNVRLDGVAHKGYALLRRRWKRGDCVELVLPMPVERLRAHPKVTANTGRVALQRGPIVYCFEQADNGKELDQLALPKDARVTAVRSGKLGGLVELRARGVRFRTARDSAASHDADRRHRLESAALAAVPYALWGNRKAGEMLVWMREA